MSLIKRESIGTSIIFFIGVVLGYVNLIFVYPFCLNLEQIGLIKLLLSLSTFFASFVPIGSHLSIIKFLPKYKTKGEEFEFVSLLLIVPLIGFILFLLVFLVGYDQYVSIYELKSPDIVNYTIQLLFLVFNIGYYKLLLGISSAYFKVIIPTFLKEIYIRLGILVILLAFYFANFEFSIAVNSILIIYSSATIILLFYIFNKVNLKFKFPFLFLKFGKQLNELFKYGFLVMLSNSSIIITKNVDLIMIGAMLGLKETGIYSIVYLIGQIVEIPKRALSRISSAVISAKWEKKKLFDIESIYKKSSIINLIIGGVIYVLIWENISDLFLIMPKGEVFEQGKKVIFILGMAKLIDLTAGNNGEIIKTSDHYWFSFASTSALAIAAIVFNYILIPSYGLIGAAFATFLAIVSNNILMGLFIYFKFRIHPFSIQSLWSVIFIISLFIIGGYIPMIINPYFSIFIRSVVILICFFIGILNLNLSNDLKQMVLNSINKFKPKKNE